MAARESLFATILRSYRVNPAWDLAVTKVFSNILTIQAQGIAARTRVWSDAVREVGDIQMQTWSNAQPANDRTAHAFSQNIRDVDTFVDPSSGDAFEFDDTHQYVWSNGLEEFIPTDDVTFDPAAHLGGNWTRYEIQR